VVSIFSKNINASFFRTGNCGGRKFIHILTVQTTLIWCDAQMTLQCIWTTVSTSSPTHKMPASYYRVLGSILGQYMNNMTLQQVSICQCCSTIAPYSYLMPLTLTLDSYSKGKGIIKQNTSLSPSHIHTYVFHLLSCEVSAHEQTTEVYMCKCGCS
jgi:hypothetical protein